MEVQPFVDPFPTDEVVLFARSQRVLRRVRPDPSGYRIEFQPPGAPIDFAANTYARCDDRFYRMVIPATPGLLRPTDGEATEVTFSLRAPGGAEANFQILLPYVASRSERAAPGQV